MNTQVIKSMPTAGAVHIDRPMTNISIAYIQDNEEFIADKVFPKIPVDKQSNMYYTFNKEHFFRSKAQLRAPGTKSAGGGVELDTDTYICPVYSFHQMIPDQVRQNADEALDMDMVATINVSRQLLLLKEIKFSEVAFNKSNWTKSRVGAAAAGAGKFVHWDNYTDSDPIKDIRELRMAIKKSTGFSPNLLVLPELAFEVVRLHPKVRDIYKYTTDQVVTEDMLAKVFGVEKIILSKAVQTTSEEGLDTPESYDWINKNSALLCYSTKNPGLMSPTAAYQFCWKHVGGGNGDTVIKTIRVEEYESDKVEGQSAFVFKVICKDLGLVLENLISA